MVTIPNATLAMFNAGLDHAILLDKSKAYEYGKDGKRTSDTPFGDKYTVALQGNRLMQMDVKVSGQDTIPNITSEMLSDGIKQGRYTMVSFEGMTVKIFNINGRDNITATANSIVVRPATDK
jgi:hypothetical protein